MNATQINNMSPEDIFHIREKVLPRRRSIRAIFEPLHRTEVDLRDTSLGSDEEKSQLWSKYPPDKPSTQIMKTKRSCKIGIINCKKGTNGTNSSASRSKSLASAASKASRPSTSSKNKSKTENVKHNRSKSTGNGNKRKSVVLVVGDDDGYEPSSDKEDDASTAASLLAKLEEMRNKLNERIAKELKLRIPERKGTNSGGEETIEDEFPFLLDHNLNFSTSLPPFKPLSIPNKANLGENISISSNKPKRKRDKHLRTTKTPPVPNEREKQFRALYDRIRAHYLIQEEMCKAMTQKDKLEKTINNTVHFEKELLEYLALPDAHPQAKLVLKELRSRRADMVTRLTALTEPNQSTSNRTLTRQSTAGKSSSRVPRLPVRSRQKLASNTNNNAGKIARRKSSAVKSKRSLVNPSKNMIPASLRPKTSKKFSRKSMFKMLDNMIKEAQDRKGQNNPGLQKSDFIRMLPHAEEIPKHVSKVVTEDQQSQHKLHSGKRDPRTYMLWLEEIMADKVREQRKSSDIQSQHESISGQQHRQVPPKWTVIASKTAPEDPFGPFKSLNPKDEEPGKRTPLLSRPRPIVKALSRRVHEQLEAARIADRSKLSHGQHHNGPTLEAIEKAIRDVIAHQSKFMEQSSSSSASKHSNNPLRQTRLPETQFREAYRSTNSGVPPQHNRPISTIMKPKTTIEEPPSAQTIIHTTNSDMGPPVTGISQQPQMSRTVTIRPAAAIIAGALKNPLSAAAKANREQLTGSIPRVVMMPTVTKPDDNNNKTMHNKDSDKINNYPHRPGTTNNIYSNPRSILKPMLPLTTALKVRIPKPAPRLPNTTTTTTAKTAPVPLPNYAQPRFLDQFLNKNETQRLFASGQPDAVSTSVF